MDSPHSASGSHCLVCFALNEEAKPFRQCVAESSGIKVIVTGMGRHNAEQQTRAALDQSRPDWVATCGFAGGLNPELQQGAVVFSTDEGFPLIASLLNAGAQRGTFHCSSRVIPTAKEKKILRARTGADAVEMESAAIRRLCAERQIPSATIRVISDMAGEDLPLDFNPLFKPDQSLSYGKLAFMILRHPALIAALMRLQKQTSQAARQLAQVLARIMDH